MQKSLLAIIFSSLILSGCQKDSGSTDTPNLNQPSPIKPNPSDKVATHFLCVTEKVNGQSQVLAAQPRHGASTITAIDSVNQLSEDFNLEVLSKIEFDLTTEQGRNEFKTAMATNSSIMTSQMTATFSALILVHACSSQEYDSSGCATRVISPWTTEDPEAEYIRLNTSIKGQDYLRRIEFSTSEYGPWTERMRLEGKVGDIGNISLFSLLENGKESRLDYQRTESGDEKVQFTSDDMNFVLTENDSCSGSIDYHIISDIDEIKLDGRWQFSEGRTHANLNIELNEFGEQPKSYKNNYQW